MRDAVVERIGESRGEERRTCLSLPTTRKVGDLRVDENAQRLIHYRFGEQVCMTPRAAGHHPVRRSR
jgi:hypothetical protein